MGADPGDERFPNRTNGVRRSCALRGSSVAFVLVRAGRLRAIAFVAKRSFGVGTG